MRAYKRMIVLLLSLLTVLLVPWEAWVATEVRHGESPQFSRPISGRYAVTVVGHYTDREGLAAAGVRTVQWESDKPVKRRAEMLALRTAFLEWFVEEWVRQGGAREEAVFQIQQYPFR
jgi:hypothetical protein